MIVSKIRYSHISKDVRFNSSFFLNQDATNSRLLEENIDKCLPLSSMANVFNPPIFKRQFCQNTEHAVPYCQSSDVTNLIEGSDTYVNKESAQKVGSIVKENQILVTGFGTIGNVKLASELTDGICFANNVCRIETKSNKYYGFIYAFLLSKYGKSQINKNSSGSVVKYIEAPGIRKTLIPILNEEIQKNVHDLIIETTKLRVEANKIRNEYISYIERELDINILKQNNHPIYFTQSIKEIGKESIASWNHSPFYGEIKNKIMRKNFLSMEDCCMKNGIFLGKLFKRIPSSAKLGYELISQRDIVNVRSDGRFISGKSVKNVNDYFVVKGSIIIAAVGATDPSYTFGIGHYVHKNYENKFINPDTLRIIPNNDVIKPGYLFAFLDSRAGKMLFHSCVYGTKLIRFIPNLLNELPIWLPNSETQTFLHNLVVDRYEKINKALILENKAIAIIEKEIESWQKS
ncbi:hypothetical protein OX284_015915 [Flavobacterium sp. SUN046]|uniref:hypothetical protein n=1 Tax=Flavobacterium sp. SUN046 TaxID=3002440 RepID=UPI002DB6ED7A|nr:hypothetical protein [Flavobacterium sp. SUN046]MEC4050924.1 hypothetical protein [Flavobacterium sp. SUN046]